MIDQVNGRWSLHEHPLTRLTTIAGPCPATVTSSLSARNSRTTLPSSTVRMNPSPCYHDTGDVERACLGVQ
jgi:hypothetical protein